MAGRRLVALFVLLGAVFSVSQVAAVLPTAQLSAMNELCSILGTHMGWNCMNDPCSWQFVSCNEAGTSVTHLLNGTGVPAISVGTNIPATLSDLVDLNELTMKSLGWTGAIPDGLLSLPALTKLDLSGNKLSGDLGTMQNPQLTYLDISNNEFTGNFPSLSGVPLLSTLILSGNGFNGEIPADAFTSVPALTHLESTDTQFSGSVEAFAGRNWDILILRGNNFELCPAPTASIAATTNCDLTEQGTCSGSCASSWSSCQMTTSDVTCVTPGTPLVPSDETPLSPEQSQLPTVTPLAHCWSVNSTTNEVFALFGYDASGAVNASQLELNVTNGELDSYPEEFESGPHLLSIRVLVNNASLIVGFGFGSGAQEVLNPSDPSKQCPDIPLVFVVSYASTSNASNIAAAVRKLYSESLPYPLDLIATRDWNAKRAPGDVEVTLQPGPGANPIFAASKLFSQPLPQTTETGPSTAPTRLISAVPQPVGAAPVVPPSPPPALTRSAKGAIGLAIAVAVLIILIALLLRLSRKSHKLPTVGRRDHDKELHRPLKPKKGRAVAKAISADPAAAQVHEEEVYHHGKKRARSKQVVTGSEEQRESSAYAESSTSSE